VVEHAIQYHFHTPGVTFLRESGHVLHGPELRRNRQIVQRIVFVVGIGQVYGVEVKNIHTQALQVAQPGGHAIQVSAPKVQFMTPDIGSRPVGATSGFLTPAVQHLGWRVQRALGFQVGRWHKTVHQHLVNDGTVAPVLLARFEHAPQDQIVLAGKVWPRLLADGSRCKQRAGKSGRNGARQRNPGTTNG
jgi:hypothetical protein